MEKMTSKTTISSEIKKVLRIQAASLSATQSYIGPAFEKAVRMMLRCTGKIVLTGIGKSGLISQKISSTLSSTGTPSIFLHPVEGLHGDLGVINKNDIVLAIGKSGESEEILNILPALKKIGAPIIALTSNKESTLARYANLVLWVPINKEACPLNLAPTTSATVALVIGDALAIALMKLRGFDEHAFALFHPGGLLGKSLLLRVKDVMREGKRNPLVRLSDSVDHLLIEITDKWTGAASVIDNKGKLIGLVTDFDIRGAFGRGERISEIRIADIMTPKPIFVYENDMAIHALSVMESRKKPLTVLPVVNKTGKAVGMVHLHDFIAHGIVSGKRS